MTKYFIDVAREMAKSYGFAGKTFLEKFNKIGGL